MVVTTNQMLFSENSVKEAKNLSAKLVARIFTELGVTNEIYLSKYREFLKKRYPDANEQNINQRASADRKFLVDPCRTSVKVVTRVLLALGHSVIGIEMDGSCVWIKTLEIDALHKGENYWVEYDREELFKDTLILMRHAHTAGLNVNEILKIVVKDTSIEKES